ncbi:MAG: DnaJ domain-containing protein [Nitrospiria bacterium]
MDDSYQKKRFIDQKEKLKRHLVQLAKALPEDLDLAFDRYFETHILSYLRIEEKLNHIETLLLKFDQEIEACESMGILRQLIGRVDFVADRLDELEAMIYRRSRRRSRYNFQFSNFFKRFNQQNGNGSASKGEIHSLPDAYRVLNLEEGSSLTDATTSFRELAKKHHPDTRGGDKNDDLELRRVVESYKMIKASLS